MKRLNREKGFTLIEVVAVLVLVGILAAIAGIGISSIVKGFFLVKESTESVQKTQLAMTRLTKELAQISAISDPTTENFTKVTSMTYTTYKSDMSSEHTLSLDSLDGSSILIDGDVLLSPVKSDDDDGLQLSYDSLTNRLDIVLKVITADGVVKQISGSIVPRNKY